MYILQYKMSMNRVQETITSVQEFSVEDNMPSRRPDR